MSTILRALSGGTCALSACPVLFWALFYFLDPKDALGSCIFPEWFPALRSTTSPKSSCSLVGDWYLETKIWVLVVLTGIKISLLLGPLSGQSLENIYVSLVPSWLWKEWSLVVSRPAHAPAAVHREQEGGVMLPEGEELRMSGWRSDLQHFLQIIVS